MASQRKSQELDGFVGLENSLLAEMQSRQSPFVMFLLISTHRHVARAKYLDKRQEMEIKVACPAQFPKGKQPLVPLVISNGDLPVPVTTPIV